MKKIYVLLTAVVIAGGIVIAQDTSESEKPAATSDLETPAATQPAKELKFDHLRVDLQNRRIILDAEVCKPTYGLEFFLCKWDEKSYESVLHTKAQAWQLHAGLLALGLTPGKPARWSSGYGEDAKFLPPQGAELKIELRWKDADGKQQTAEAGNWLAPAGEGEGQMPAPKKWVFVGSEVLPNGGYLADMEGCGGLISVANLSSSVIDVPFQSTYSIESRQFVFNEKTTPPSGTAVEVVITPLPGAENAEHARAVLDIDRFGGMKIDGEAISPEELSIWAGKFMNAHSSGMVVVRAAGRALVQDVASAMLYLRYGGVFEMPVVRLEADDVLPRTPQQTNVELAQWKKIFAKPDDEIIDPAEQAELKLKQLENQMKELEATRTMLADYAEQLQTMLDEYKKENPPESDSSESDLPEEDSEGN